MAATCPLKLSISHPSHRFQSPNSDSIAIHSKTRNSTVNLSYETSLRSHAIIRSKASKLMFSEAEEKPQIQVFVELLRDCATGGLIKEGKTVHGLLLKSNFGDENEDKMVVVFNHLAHMYVKCSNFADARRVFDEMPERNVFSWTVMIVGSTENGFFLDGFKFFCEMLNYGIQPDKFAYSAAVQSCVGLGSVKLGKMVHAQIVKNGCFTHAFVSTSLLNMYSKVGEIEDSVRVFNTAFEKNQVSWNAMISGFALNNLYLEAFDQFLLMKEEGFEPNIYTFASVLKAIGKLGDVIKGREVHSYASESYMESNVVVGTALIDMYSKCGCLREARLVFDKNFINCNVNTPWNAMISGYLQGGHSEEALRLFNQMCVNNINPDLFTYGSVFSACASLKSLRRGREVHGRVVKCGQNSRVLNVNNALADAYAKCGWVEGAREVFESMEERDVISWTTMVTAYAQCLEGEKALDVFSQMREEGVKPNQFTFASVLVGCASLCLLEYGRQVHSLVCKTGFGDHDCIETTLIDMYSKCGNIIEAEKVFERIVSPDVVSWTSIILGYAQHGFTNSALQFFRKMEESGIAANAITFLCVLFACSHGGMVDEGLYYFRLMKERHGIEAEMEHYACIVDLLGRVGCFNDAMKFISDMPVEPTEMIWLTLLGACRVHGNVKLGEIAAENILSVKPEYSATYVLLSNMYIETGNLNDGLSLRSVMKERGVKKEPGFSWIVVRGKVHKFFSGDQEHRLKEEIYAKLAELTEKIKAMGYVPDLKFLSQDS